MLKKFLTTSIALLIISSSVLANPSQNMLSPIPTTIKQENTEIPNIKTAPIDKSKTYKITNPLDMVKSPKNYLDSYVKILGKFDKFSTLGLDYPPINKNSKDYISFLIKKESTNDVNIPLSELKLIVKRDYAEKELINIETGDEIKILGKVFSTALGDPWVEVDKVEILTPKNEKVKEEK